LDRDLHEGGMEESLPVPGVRQRAA
jgi:hypothetical protein